VSIFFPSPLAGEGGERSETGEGRGGAGYAPHPPRSRSGPSPASGRGTVVIVALLILAACGSKGPIQPPEGAGLPPAPRGASVTPTPAEMLVPPTQAAPTRADDPVRTSKERAEDRFDLPPPG